jgi:hypothetical protein
MKDGGMKSLSIKAVCVIGICLLLHPSAALRPRGQSVEDSRWGEPVDGVQLSISAVESERADVSKFKVRFRNAGGQDINLYLGIVGGTGPRPCGLDPAPKAPCNLNLLLNVTDAAGGTRRLTFSGISFVAGRLDSAIIWLRAGSTYALEIGLDQFYSPETKEYRVELAPGRYHISAEFEGRAPEVVNIGQEQINKMSFWKGKLQSNALEFER